MCLTFTTEKSVTDVWVVSSGWLELYVYELSYFHNKWSLVNISIAHRRLVSVLSICSVLVLGYRCCFLFIRLTCLGLIKFIWWLSYLARGHCVQTLRRQGGGGTEGNERRTRILTPQPDAFLLFLLNRNMNLLTECSCWGRAGVGGCREDLSLHQRKRVCTQGRHCEHAEWGGGSVSWDKSQWSDLGHFPGRSQTDMQEKMTFGDWRKQRCIVWKDFASLLFITFYNCFSGILVMPCTESLQMNAAADMAQTAPVFQARGWKRKLLFSVTLTAVDRLFKTNKKLPWVIDTHGKYHV